MSNSIIEKKAIGTGYHDDTGIGDDMDETMELDNNESDDETSLESLRGMAELLRHLREMHDRHALSDDDDEADDDDDYDEDDDDEDCEYGDDDDEEEDYEDDDEDNDDEEAGRTGDKKVPVGKRVILRSDFKTNKAYCDAVVRSMQAVLRKNGIRESPRSIRDGIKVFAFDRTTRGVDIDCHILCEYELCNFRIEFKFNFENQPGRTPLIDYFCQDKNFPLRYGSVLMDHNDDEKKIEYSSCFYGAFAEETFNRYWLALDATLRAFAKEYESIASDKKLDADQRKIVRKLIGDLSVNLPARVKQENETIFNAAVDALGGKLSAKMKKLLNYIVEHAG